MHLKSICLALVLLGSSSGLLAQPQSKAYAPEQVERLNVDDQIRVLNKEYSDLSGGQTLRRDQLEFYLDQIRDTGRTFSQIREDMQESLGATPDNTNYGPRSNPPPVVAIPITPQHSGPGPGNYAPGPGNYGPGAGVDYVNSIDCESRRGRYSECATPFNSPRLGQQLSNAACIEGQSWGVHGRVIWVDQGCRGRFVESRRGQVSHRGTIQCGTDGTRRETCNTNFAGPAALRRQLSSSPCVEGVSWGSGPGIVWVARGCRALFEEARFTGGTPGNVGVSCESVNGGLRICNWNDRIGRPALLREYSRGVCIEGRSWGWDRRGLWVDRGCSGLFGIR